MRPVKMQKINSVINQPNNKFILRVDSESSPDIDQRIASNTKQSQDALAAEKANASSSVNQTEKNTKSEFKRKVSRSRRSDSDNGSLVGSTTSIHNPARYNSQVLPDGHHS
mgnify:CR=1 FL=1